MAEIEFDDGTRVEIPDDVVSSIRGDEVSPEALLEVVLPKLTQAVDALKESETTINSLGNRLETSQANAKKNLRIIR